jgi:hypothetical protein
VRLSGAGIKGLPRQLNEMAAQGTDRHKHQAQAQAQADDGPREEQRGGSLTDAGIRMHVS